MSNNQTTTNPSNLPAVIDNEKFGSLINLPDILRKNQDLVSRAVAAVVISAVDVKTLDIIKLDEMDAQLNTWAGKVNDAKKLCEDRRKPSTTFMNDVISLFTAEETKLADLKEKIVHKRQQIAFAKKDLQKKAEEEKQKKLKEEQDRIDAIAKKRKEAVDAHTEIIGKNTQFARDLFYKDIDAFEAKLSNPTKEYDFGYDDLNATYLTEMQKVRDELKEKIPGRRRELEEIAAGNKKTAEEALKRKEEEDLKAKQDLEKNKQNQHESDTVQNDAAKLNASYDVHSTTANVNIKQAKGTTTKKKYKPTNHKGHIAIMRWWTQTIMPGLTMEDLAIKLSFMRTAADKHMNDTGEKIISDGLEITEDIKVKTSK